MLAFPGFKNNIINSTPYLGVLMWTGFCLKDYGDLMYYILFPAELSGLLKLDVLLLIDGLIFFIFINNKKREINIRWINAIMLII